MATIINPRISGRLGQLIDLNVTFYRDGVPTDPWAVLRVDIYRLSVQQENLIVSIPILPPCDPNYPSPLSRETTSGVSTNECGVVTGSGSNTQFLTELHVGTQILAAGQTRTVCAVLSNNQFIVSPPFDPPLPPGTPFVILPEGIPGSGTITSIFTPTSGSVIPSTNIKPGVYHLYWDVPKDIVVPNIFFDVWTYIPDNPFTSSGPIPVIPPQYPPHVPPCPPTPLPPTPPPWSGSEITCDQWPEILENLGIQQRCCNEFWLYPEGFVCDTGLTNIRLGFEAIDIKFYQPEIRTLEVGLMPLPLYDFDYNKIVPIIPFLKAYFTMMTDARELIIDKALMNIGIRAGTYRSNPFTLRYLLDTGKYLKGSYIYRVDLQLPNGETRSSPEFILQIS